MNKSNKILTLVLVSLIVLMSLSFTEPGTDSDPLITLTYFESRYDVLKAYVDENFVNKADEVQVEAPAYKFIVVGPVSAGTKIILGDSAEFILRAGRATAIGNGINGLSDLTTGIDVGTGEEVQLNHHLLSPRDDGRGVTAITDGVYVMVKGVYSITE